MRKIVDNCVGCKDMGLPCLGSSCPNGKTYVEFCDECDNLANCFLDGKALSEDCAQEYLTESFGDLSVKEKAEVLQMDYDSID